MRAGQRDQIRGEAQDEPRRHRAQPTPRDHRCRAGGWRNEILADTENVAQISRARVPGQKVVGAEVDRASPELARADLAPETVVGFQYDYLEVSSTAFCGSAGSHPAGAVPSRLIELACWLCSGKDTRCAEPADATADDCDHTAHRPRASPRGRRRDRRGRRTISARR